MAEKSPDKSLSDPLEMFQLSKDMLAAQQKFLPTGAIYTQFAETMRNVAQANIAYMREMMRANASLLAAFTAHQPDAGRERPSAAAHRPDSAAP